jgi:Homeodomain-like domain
VPRYVHITAHLRPDELEQGYRQANDPVERSRFQIIWLLVKGKRVREVAEVTGYCANWIRILARRYNRALTSSPCRSTSAQQRSSSPALS